MFTNFFIDSEESCLPVRLHIQKKHIVAIEETETGVTRIHVTGGKTFLVNESPQSVLRHVKGKMPREHEQPSHIESPI